MKKAAFRRLIILIFAGALLIRVTSLGLRPMHHDEANQALKFGRLLESGEYRYDRADHHGPSLYYLTLPFARLSSENTLAALNERTLRLVPAVFGAGIILLLLLFGGGMTRTAALFAGLLFTLSPAFSYYSRFYIQEMLFVFFLVAFMGAIWRYYLRPGIGWAAAAGFFAGMAHATKETAAVMFAVIGAAAVIAFTLKKNDSSPRPGKIKFWPSHLFVALACGLLTSGLLFSSFLGNPKGVADSFLAYPFYFAKGAAGGLHAHSWWYYLGLLGYSRSAGGQVWTEGFVLALAAIGGIAIVAQMLAGRKRRISDAIPSNGIPRESLLKNRQVTPQNLELREEPAFRQKGGSLFSIFVLIYTILSSAVFSLIAYKTPWNLLPFYAGFVLLAGMGVDSLFRLADRKSIKALFGLIIVAGTVQLGFQAWRTNFRSFADPDNPYVYAHTSQDFLGLVARIEDLAAVHPSHKNMLVKVVAGPYETWPLPWYLRSFSRVGYWEDWHGAGGFEGVPIIVASRDQAERISPLVGGQFVSEYYGLRPEVLLTLFIERGLWESYLKTRTPR
jgi:uncharacterized protein (TIGR03663 family)